MYSTNEVAYTPLEALFQELCNKIFLDDPYLSMDKHTNSTEIIIIIIL